jgi:hypothetical protein
MNGGQLERYFAINQVETRLKVGSYSQSGINDSCEDSKRVGGKCHLLTFILATKLRLGNDRVQVLNH